MLRYRRLGRTGLRVSEIGLGGGGIGGVYGETSYEEAVRTVRRALELGVNFFDVAPAYGGGQAERVLAEGLRGKREHVIVGTKVALPLAPPGDLRRFVRRSVEQSLRRLRSDYVDVLFVHNPLSAARGRPVQRRGDIAMVTVADALALGGHCEELRTEGHVRHLGFTGWRCTRTALVEMLESGLFDVVQVEYNLLNQSAVATPAPEQDVTSLETLEASADTDMAGWAYRPIDQHLAINLAGTVDLGIVCIRPLAGGLLSGRLDRADEPGTHLEVLRDRVSALSFLSVPGRSLTQSALAFCLAQPAISTVIPGVKNVTELDEAVRASQHRALGRQEVERVWEVSRSTSGAAAKPRTPTRP
jgi:aryl-alcohol dehydrogenase-like predicted oxidoreductase